MRLSPGTVFGPYRVLAEIGVGGQGAIYRAHHATLEQDVALKVLLTDDRTQRKRFLQEAQVLARIDHPNVVRVRDAGEIDGVPFLSMDLVEGKTLKRVAVESEAFDEQRIRSVLAPLSDALQRCHERGVVHRDLKPENVLLEGGSGRPVLVDFGLVKRDPTQLKLGLDKQSVVSLEGEIKGTPVYMAPEQVDPSFGEEGPHTDVYALGALLFFLLERRPPYDASLGFAGVIMRVMQGRVQAPTQGPAHLRALCSQAMDPDPTLRPASASAFAAALERSKGPRARRLAGPVVGVLAIVGVVALAWAIAGTLGSRASNHTQASPSGAVSADKAAFASALDAGDAVAIVFHATRLLEGEDSPLVRLERAKASATLKRGKEALADLEILVARPDASPEARYLLAKALDSRGAAADADRVVRLLADLAETGGEQRTASFDLWIRCLVKRGDFRAAAEVCALGRERLPAEPAALLEREELRIWEKVLERARLREDRETILAAADWLRRRAEETTAPSVRAEAWRLAAVACYQWFDHNNYDSSYRRSPQALEVFKRGVHAAEQALPLLPGSDHPGHLRAVLYATVYMNKEALRLFEDHLKRFPDDLNSLNAAANLHLRVKNYAGATVHFEALVERTEVPTRKILLRYNLAFAQAFAALGEGQFERAGRYALVALEFAKQAQLPGRYARLIAVVREAQANLQGSPGLLKDWNEALSEFEAPRK